MGPLVCYAIDMIRIAYHPIYCHPVPEKHRFPMEKYPMLREQLLHEGIFDEDDFFEPSTASLEHVALVHKKDYIQKLIKQELSVKEVRQLGFAQSELLVERELTLVQGTIEGSKWALQNGMALNIAGGTHHAYSDHGEGFCLLNDQAVAAATLLEEGLAKRILILDLDVHQGNGTAEIFRNDPRVLTFSMHGANNYPLRKEESDIDIALPDQCSDTEYLHILGEELEKLSDLGPFDFLFYQSGVDPLEMDKLGKLSLSLDGLKQRDAMVFEWALQKGLPIQVSMGGGYAPELKDILKAHRQTFELARDIFS